MKEYINRLSLGKFRYDIPDIIKPDDVVRVDVLCGTYSEEQLHIQASDVIKGVVYSSDSRVVIKNGTFIGRECSITYIADARELQDKESIEGRFTIVSDAGEKDIAYIITGYSMKAKTSLGMGDDLFHFTNIVQKSREEATYAHLIIERLLLSIVIMELSASIIITSLLYSLRTPVYSFLPSTGL